MRKLVVSIVLFTMLMFLSHGQSVNAEELVTNSKSGILIEVETGRILYELDAHTQFEPASMTKMMSMYLVMEAIEAGKLAWEDTINVSDHAASLGGTQIFLEPGEELSVEDLFRSVAIASANDSVTALAEAVAGTEEEFVRLMNERAADFGLENTHFENPTGLPAEGHLSSAYDMAIISKMLLRDFPEVVEVTSIYESYVREDSDDPFWLVNTNKLVRYVDGVDGLKTGFTQAAGYCLSATAIRDDMRVVAVVMGAERSDIRNREVARLIEYAYLQYELTPRIAVGEIVGNSSNILARGRRFDVVTSDSVSLISRKGEELGEERSEVTIISDLVLPINPGDEVGKLVYFYNDEVYQEVVLTVAKPVEKTSFVALFGHVLGSLLFGGSR